MAGPVQETSPQQQATKRSAEADPEPSPVTKRPAEDPERKHQTQPTDVSTTFSLLIIALRLHGLIVFTLKKENLVRRESYRSLVV